MKHKTAELEGVLLDAAVAKALGRGPYFGKSPPDKPNPDSDPMWRDAEGWPIRQFSTNWAVGGPLIEREQIDVWHMSGVADADAWCASSPGMLGFYAAVTPLVAAMRAFVYGRLGKEVDL